MKADPISKELDKVPDCLRTNEQKNKLEEIQGTRKRQHSQIAEVSGEAGTTAKVRKANNFPEGVNHKHPFMDSTNTFKTPELPSSRWQKGTSQTKPAFTMNGSACFRKENSFSFKTPNQSNVSITPSNSSSLCASNSFMKRTPPMCGCGRRAQRKFVQSPGPNQGRIFFCCPHGEKKTVGCFGTRSGQSGCGFFKWEQSSTSGSSCTRQSQVNGTFTPSSSTVNSVLKAPILQPNFSTPACADSTNEKCKKKTLGLMRLSQTKS